jgi:outer membrane scaffolding protein for murein synthesis (MipA/OmpV family)
MTESHLLKNPPAFAQPDQTDSSVQAEQAASEEQSMPQASGSQPGNNFSFALGAGVIVSPRPYVGADFRVFPMPSWVQDLQVAEAEVRKALRQVEQTRIDISRPGSPVFVLFRVGKESSLFTVNRVPAF